MFKNLTVDESVHHFAEQTADKRKPLFELSFVLPPKIFVRWQSVIRNRDESSSIDGTMHLNDFLSISSGFFV
jgi:hypothetical protein